MDTSCHGHNMLYKHQVKNTALGGELSRLYTVWFIDTEGHGRNGSCTRNFLSKERVSVCQLIHHKYNQVLLNKTITLSLSLTLTFAV